MDPQRRVMGCSQGIAPGIQGLVPGPDLDPAAAVRVPNFGGELAVETGVQAFREMDQAVVLEGPLAVGGEW
jgi:hypothetical protein